MYKIFFNKNEILLSDKKNENIRNFYYDSKALFELVIYFLSDSKNKIINIYHEDLSNLWNNFTSHFNLINAAGGIVENKNNEILFIFRHKKWDLPKGKVEKNEDFQTAAIREVEEECGISGMKIQSFYKTTYHIYSLNNEYVLKSSHWYKMSYNENDILIPQIEEGIEKVEWKNSIQIKDALKNTFPNIKELLSNY